MARHGLKYNLRTPFAKETFLQPSNEITPVLSTEDIHCHGHHPHAERCRHNQVFGLRYYNAVFNLRLYAITTGIIKEEKLYPTCPKEQPSEESPKRLTRIALN